MAYANPAVQKARAAERRVERKAAGICHSCPAPARKGKTRCAKCAGKENARLAERKAAGICPQCNNNPARKGKMLCADCAAKQKASRAERKAAGLCVKCTAPARKGKTLCAKCTAKSAGHATNLYHKRKEAGQCAKCPAPARKGMTMCAKCTAKQKARMTKSLIDRAAAEKAPFYRKQKGRCALCQGLPPSVEWLEIDHIRPRSKGGDDDAGNLQLVCSRCNRVKGDRPQADALDRLRELNIIDAAGNNIEVGYVAG